MNNYRDEADEIMAQRQANIGNQYYNRGNYYNAANCYIKSLQYMANPKVFCNCANAEKRLGNIQGAITILNQGIHIYSQNSTLYTVRGSIYMNNRQYIKAISDFNKISQLDNNYNNVATAELHKGECYLQLDDLSSAEDALESAVSYNKEFIQAYLLLGNVYVDDAKYLNGKDEYSRAININPNIPVTYYNRAHCLLLYKQYSKELHHVIPPNVKYRITKMIKSDMTNAIKLNPHFKKYINKLKSQMGGNAANVIKLKSNENPTKELNNMIGLYNVKKEIRQYIFGVKMAQKTGSHNRESMNIVFEGNPGTGKTQVANLLPKVLYQNHALQKPVFVSTKASDLVSKWQGQSGRNMKNAIDKAMGGVLFIDEAYKLLPQNSNGGESEVVNELLQDAENYRGKLIIILAGYPKEMENFLSNSNPGMRSRFDHVITFPNYTSEELYQIFTKFLLNSHELMEAKDLIYVKKNIAKVIKFMEAKNLSYGNARLPRYLLSSMDEAKRSRLSSQYDVNSITPKMYHSLTSQDVINGFNQYYQSRHIDPSKITGGSSSSFNPNEDAYQELQNMIGLTSVKSKIKGFIDNLKANQFFGNGNDIDLGNMNIVFEGAPGTGKTQVARLMAKIMFQKGIIKIPRLKECSARDLVSQYSGDTGHQTARVVKSALGGILFIDEAYDLGTSTQSTSGENVNAEAVASLIQLMENHRHELLVIMAGYTQPMEDFLNTANPGLNSRFPNKVLFPNYNSKEMYQIMMLHAKSKKYHCIFNDSARQQAQYDMNDFVTFIQDNNLRVGNGRDARNILQSILQMRNERVVNNMDKYANNHKQAEIIHISDINKGFANTKKSKQLGGTL